MKQKRYWIWWIVSCIVVIFVALTIFSTKNNQQSVSVSTAYDCGIQSGVGQFGTFMIETSNDGVIRFRIPSKPPQTEAIVTKTAIANGYEYKGDGVTITDLSKDNVEVNYNGRVVRDCHKK